VLVESSSLSFIHNIAKAVVYSDNTGAVSPELPVHSNHERRSLSQKYRAG
jgi:hypothetical protein